MLKKAQKFKRVSTC